MEENPLHIYVFTDLCQKAWSTNKWPEQWTQSLVIPFFKKYKNITSENVKITEL